jgi:hypothetical protein
VFIGHHRQASQRRKLRLLFHLHYAPLLRLLGAQTAVPPAEGVLTWKRIVKAMLELLKDEPDDGERIN